MRKRSKIHQTLKRQYLLLCVNGGGDSREADFAVLTLDIGTADLFLRRCALASALRTLDSSVAHVSFHGNFCTWLSWCKRLDELLDNKECVTLSQPPRGKPVDMDACYMEVWADGEIYLTGYEKHTEGQPTWQAGPVPREMLEAVKRRLAPAEGNQ